MRIQHNISSLNAYRNYTNNTNSVAKNLEKLSSGYRINRAGDDAAGLAISEKMRAQITGLETAQKNAADGVSLVQTAEGALTEVHSMLNRMVELADQSANGTYDNEVDRKNLQKEIKDLKSEIDRIADATNFNGINLLNGNLSKNKMLGADVALAGVQVSTDKVAAQKAEFVIDLKDVSFTTAATKNGKFKLTIGGVDIETAALGVGTTKNGGELATALKTAIDAGTFGGGATGKLKIGNVEYDVAIEGGTKLKFTMTADPKKDATAADLNANFDVTMGFVPDGGAAATDGEVNGSLNAGTLVIQQGVKPSAGQAAEAKFTLTPDMLQNGSSIKIGNETYVFKTEKDANFTLGADQKLVDLSQLDPKAADYLEKAGKLLTTAAAGNKMFTVGQDANGDITLAQKMDYAGDDKDLLKTEEGIQSLVQQYDGYKAEGLTLQIGDTSADFNKLNVSIEDCHTDSLGIADIDISTQEGAAAAVDKIKNAINYVSDVRGTLGATQNRLEHTINNLSVTTENMTAAESRIRDVDVAKEMMAYTKNNILVQSAQAMLAQANQTPQGVLQLLQ